jgi:hypothetical protein
LPAQLAIFFNQIRDRISLATLHPAGDGQQQPRRAETSNTGGVYIRDWISRRPRPI